MDQRSMGLDQGAVNESKLKTFDGGNFQSYYHIYRVSAAFGKSVCLNDPADNFHPSLKIFSVKGHFLS